MSQANATSSVPTPGGFDSLRILDSGFTVTVGGTEYDFETPKDALGRIISINGCGKNRPIVYAKQSNTAGIEYEQVESDEPNLVPPEISDVEVEVLDGERGIYMLSVSPSDCTLDQGAEPFIFFKAWDGVFDNYTVDADGTASVVFISNELPADGDALVIIGIGDGLGQSHRKSIILKGDSQI